jgi:2-iminobutanoate/2-iminopropanoate deaminase
MRKLISTAKALKPIRPYYSQAVEVDNAEKLIFVSGQTWDPKLGGAARGDAAMQAEFAIESMKAILAESGATLDDVVKVTVYLRKIGDLDRIAPVRMKYFGKSPPSSTLVVVSELFHPDLLIEIDAIAVVPS